MSDIILSLKAFGDFVIAHSVYIRHQKYTGETSSIHFAIGAHLQQLADAMGATDVHILKSHGHQDVPAIFDIQKKGLWLALRSAYSLRRQLQIYPSESNFILDKNGPRERFIGGHHHLQFLPDAENIYLAYERFLNLESPVYKNFMNPKKLLNCLIIPSSRLKNKILPTELIVDTVTLLKDMHISSQVLELEGEAIKVPISIEKKIIPKTFDALIHSIRSVDFIISADSLPAHLAEYYKIPIFVFTPTSNKYWLPLSAYKNTAWSNFFSIEPLEQWLKYNFTYA
jgi:hypothetical protein